MVVFTTVLAEISPTVVSLLPDPLNGKTSALKSYLLSQDEDNLDIFKRNKYFTNGEISSIVYEAGINSAHIYSDRVSLSELRPICTTQEDEVVLEELSSVQRKGSFLNERLKALHPNLQVLWSKLDSLEILKVFGPWESVVNVHPWLEQLVEELVVQSKAEQLRETAAGKGEQLEMRKSEETSHVTVNNLTLKEECKGDSLDMSVDELAPNDAEVMPDQKKRLQKTVAESAQTGRSNSGLTSTSLESNGKRRGKFSCDDCGFRTNLSHALKLHRSVTHPPSQATISSGGLKSTHKNETDTNIEVIKRRRGRPPKAVKPEPKTVAKREPGSAVQAFTCNLCDYMTLKPRNLVFHRARIHGERHLSCPVCEKTFAIRKDLNQHLRFHSERFCCEQCGKTLRSKYALSLHISVIHNKAQPKPAKSYLCNLCGRLCRSKTDYTIHCNKEHLGIHPHACKICGMRFFAKANLKVHLQVHAESKNFVCQECGKTFRQRQGLRVHQNIHKEERPYRCSLCDKTFTQRGALVRHARTHTTDRPYACKLCSSTFNDYSILRRHMLGIHKMDDHTILRQIVKEACAEARDLEKSRQMQGVVEGTCKAETTTGFDTANTLIALSQQSQDLGHEAAALPRTECIADGFPVLSLTEASPLEDFKGMAAVSSSSLICFTAPNIVSAAAGRVSDSLGSSELQLVGTDMVQYISLPYDQLSTILGSSAIQNSQRLQ